jgi:methionyl-tRNA formyltransferase
MRIVMMGTGSFAEPTFTALLAGSHPVVGLVTQPDRATGTERGSTRQAHSGMKEIAQARGIPILQPENINNPDGVRDLKTWQPDLFVVAAYGQILSREVLEIAAKGGINVHASLLPKYRGAAPIAWAIYNGERESGVTIIRMSTALDAGDILAQEKTSIGSQETAGELENRLAPIGAHLALRVIGEIETGTSKGVPQNKAQVTKAPKLTKENGLIDWRRSANEVCNQIRAMQPWPTPYTFLHRPKEMPMRLLIFRAGEVLDATLALAGPQAGLIRQPRGMPQICVETGAGDEVKIYELQPAGKRRMTAEDFLRGCPIQNGWRLGGENP